MNGLPEIDYLIFTELKSNDPIFDEGLNFDKSTFWMEHFNDENFEEFKDNIFTSENRHELNIVIDSLEMGLCMSDFRALGGKR